eukprot:CCRYP_016933-RA/>CCRYP_016933-RA protein AED:0.63 eAED:0.45 QI:0/0/0/0.5/1/1/2/0/311
MFFLAAKQLTAVVKSLARVDALSDEAVSDIMDGLAKGSVTKFTEVFKLDSTLYHSQQTSTTSTGGSNTARGVILLTLEKATDLHNSLSTGNNWYIPSGRVHSCWNCNGDHGVNKCKEPKDQSWISANKKKWEEEKQKKSGHSGTGSGSGSGRANGNQYEWSKFGDKKGNQQPLGSGVAKFNNSTTILKKEAILSRDRYEAGDFVSADQFAVKTPGRMLSGFGREDDRNKFHGGTIFQDAGTGIIWVECQVSLGAGKTVMSKVRFEERFWEMAAAEIRHLHSDNGVFTADMFRADCKMKHQSQSFSGVDAKH